MDPRVEAIFLEATNLETAARRRYLASACAGDDVLRAEIEELLGFHDQTHGMRRPLERDPGHLLVVDRGSSGAAPGTAARQRIGQYTIVKELGFGGMGQVYLAQDTVLDDRLVALKLLPPHAATSAAMRARFKREAKLLARIEHQNIATIHSLEQDGDLWFITMEYVRGETLDERIAGGPLPVDEALEVCGQIARGLRAAHENSIVHRDLKPLNIMFSRDEVIKILDFGIAKSTADSPDQLAQSPHPATNPGLILGTPGYQSPEQIRGGEIDRRTDVWAFGCILFECLTGVPAFDGRTRVDRMAACLEREPDWSLLPEDTPRVARRILTGCLRKAADERIGDIDIVLADLERARASSSGYSSSGAELKTRTNLPRSLDRFFGRVDDKRRVQEILETERLVTLCGAGGCGKTRLALEIARDQLQTTSGAVWIIELAPVVDPAFVPRVIAAALGVKEEHGRTSTESIVDAVGANDVLLLVDNAEHVLASCARFADDVLRRCPNIRLLATSREPLGTAGERIYPVKPLAVPKTNELDEPDDLAENEAVRLFVDRAAAIRRGFALGEDNARTIGEICQRLDGIPLALELAAARVRALSESEILDRLGDRFRLLRSGAPSPIPHHQTLEALVSWSYDGLSTDLQELLRRLSVFVGGWTLDAAETICAGSDIEPAEVIDPLSSLVDKSLVEVDFESGSRAQKTRYRMLETIRQFMLERLVETDGVDAARRRHVDFVAGLVAEAAPHLSEESQRVWLDRLEAEHDNLRSALEVCRNEDPARGLDIVASLEQFWWVRGHRREGLRHCTSLLDQHGDAATIEQAKALLCCGHLAQGLGDHAHAEVATERALAIFRQLGDKERCAIALGRLAGVSWRRGDFERCEALYEEGLALAQELDLKPTTAATLRGLAHASYQRGNYKLAKERSKEALLQFRDLGDLWSVGKCVNLFGTIAFHEGDYERANPYFEEYFATMEKLGDRAGMAEALCNLGLVARNLDEPERAETLHEQALELFRDQEDRRGVAASLGNLGDIALLRGQLARAHALYKESLPMFVQQGDVIRIVLLLEAFSALELQAGDVERATRLLSGADAMRQDMNAARNAPDIAVLEEQMAKARSTLGEEAFAAAWAAGQSSTREELVALALNAELTES